jgi:hypothetical protein
MRERGSKRAGVAEKPLSHDAGEGGAHRVSDERVRA